VASINGSVGRGGANARGDVIAVQLLLNANLRLLARRRWAAVAAAERHFKVKKLVSDIPHWSADGK